MTPIRQPTPTHPSMRARAVPLEGAFNFRDAGGHRAGVRTVRSGLVYRSDGLHRLTPADLARIRRLGIRTVIDLRSTEECARFGVCDVRRLPATYHHVPLVEKPWPHPADGESASTWLSHRYLDLIEASGDGIVSVLATVADAAAWPVVFHCTGGKDRTGVVAAVLLGLLGVDDDDIVLDYCRSTPGITWLRQSLEGSGSSADHIDLPAALFEVPAQAMRQVLQRVAATHGSMERWALDAGMPPAVISALRAGLLT